MMVTPWFETVTLDYLCLLNDNYLILSQIVLEESCLVVHPASTFQQVVSHPELQHMRRVWIIRDWWYWKRGFFSFTNTVNFSLDVKWPMGVNFP